MSINIYEEVGMLFKFGLENNLIGKYDVSYLEMKLCIF